MLGHWREAARLWAEALVVRRKGTDPTNIAFTLTGLAGAERELGNMELARQHIDEALDILRKHESPTPTHLARTLIEHVETGMVEGKADCGEAEEALALMARNASVDDPARLYDEAVAAGCAWRVADTTETRERSARAQQAMRAAFPAEAAHLIQARRYASPD